MRQGRRWLLGHSAANGAVQVVGGLASLAAAVVASRWLGPSDFGRLLLAMAWVGSLATLALMGTDGLALREVSVDPARWPAVRAFSRRRLQGPTAAALVVMAVVAHTELSDDRLLVPAAAILVLLVALRLDQSALWATRGPAPALVGETVAVPGLNAVALAGLAASGLVPRHPGVALATFATAVAVVAWVQRRAVARTVEARLPHPPPATPTTAWASSARRFAAIKAVLLVQGYGFTLLLGTLGTHEQVGTFVIALRLAALVEVPMTIVAGSIAPRLTAAADDDGDGRARVQELVTSATRLGALLSALVAVVVVIGQPWLVRIFGRTGPGIGSAVMVLAAAQLVNVACGPVSRILQMTGHERDARDAIAVGTVIGVVVAGFTIPTIGAVGAALGAAVPLVVWNVVMAALVRHRLGIVAGPFGRARLAAE